MSAVSDKGWRCNEDKSLSDKCGMGKGVKGKYGTRGWEVCMQRRAKEQGD